VLLEFEGVVNEKGLLCCEQDLACIDNLFVSLNVVCVVKDKNLGSNLRKDN
jgi:hypothetical protein